VRTHHDPPGKLIAQYNLSRFRALFLAGERADPVMWAVKLLKMPEPSPPARVGNGHPLDPDRKLQGRGSHGTRVLDCTKYGADESSFMMAE
jgi:hypothetical protein